MSPEQITRFFTKRGFQSPSEISPSNTVQKKIDAIIRVENSPSDVEYPLPILHVVFRFVDLTRYVFGPKKIADPQDKEWYVECYKTKRDDQENGCEL